MASFGHVAVGMAIGRFGAGERRMGPLTGYAALALLPDADAVAFALGIPYEAPFGHRGATHSFAFAALCAVVVGMAAWLRGRDPLRAFGLALLAVASHPLLDALTTGGLGVALFWPASNERFFLPWQVIPVAPIGAGMLSGRGLYVTVWELAVFSPLWLWALRPTTRPRPSSPATN